MKTNCNEKLNHKNFLERAQVAHGEHYDYSYVKYRGASKRVKILCPTHGLFERTPSIHVNGKGCPYCEQGQLTRAEFIENANKIHNYNYDYTKCAYTHYTRNSDYLTITCKEHGDFLVRPDQHLLGRACPKCEKKTNQLIKSKSLPVWTRTITVNSGIVACVEAGTFKNRNEALEYLEKEKMLIELSESTPIESEIIYRKGTLINWNAASKLIKTLGIKSHVNYLKWWDSNQPDYLPRDLNEYYPYTNRLYLNFIVTAA